MSTITGIAGNARQQLAQEGVAFSGEIASAALRHGIDPNLLAAVAAQETGGPQSNAGRNIVGDGGHGHGLFQIDDRWHQFAQTAAAMNPAKNADYAAGMISSLLKQYGGDVHKALSAYNAGSPNATGTVTRWGDGQRLGYADSVLRHFARLGGALTGKQAAAGTQSPVSSLTSSDLSNAIGDIFHEISQTNQLQSLAQGSPAPQQFQPRSYAQLAGIDANGHTKNDTAWAGIIDAAGD